MKNLLKIKFVFPALLILFIGAAFFNELKKDFSRDNKTISFWQYWQGDERAPIEVLVKKFNEENHGFKVEMLTISLPRKKILMAVTGGVAPDLVHLDGDMVSDFANRNALQALDKSMKEKFIPVYWDMLNIKNTQYAIPLMPTCEAMHINKKLLSDAGIDQNPKSLDDLVNIFKKVTDFKNFSKIGWLPSWPPWTGRFIPVIFGGNWGITNKDGTITITANSSENISAWTWVQENFARAIPKTKLQAFTEGFSAYQSPDNPFYSGRIAAENNGVWERHLASKFAPDLEIEIIPFPIAETLKIKSNSNLATLVTVDALAIPRGAKNPELAFEFLKWLTKQENLEYIARAQHKFTPIKKVSADFIRSHPNPHIKTFIDLANSPNAVYFPQIPLVQKYRREIKEAYSRVVRLEQSPKEALDQVQKIMEASLTPNISARHLD